jgi:hypothetical protein
VHELPCEDPWHAQGEWEVEQEAHALFGREQCWKLWQEHRWVHYSTYEVDNTARSAFKQAEQDTWGAEREMCTAKKRHRDGAPFVLDLDRMPPEVATAATREPDAALGSRVCGNSAR